MTFWRAAGLNYVNYSNIAEKVVRKALKTELQADVTKRELDQICKMGKWQTSWKETDADSIRWKTS